MAEGLIPNFSIADNILLPNLKRFRSAGVVRRRALRAAVMDLIKELDIRPADPDAPVRSLSGGIARRWSSPNGWRAAQPFT